MCAVKQQLVGAIASRKQKPPACFKEQEDSKEKRRIFIFQTQSSLSNKGKAPVLLQHILIESNVVGWIGSPIFPLPYSTLLHLVGLPQSFPAQKRQKKVVYLESHLFYRVHKMFLDVVSNRRTLADVQTFVSDAYAFVENECSSPFEKELALAREFQVYLNTLDLSYQSSDSVQKVKKDLDEKISVCRVQAIKSQIDGLYGESERSICILALNNDCLISPTVFEKVFSESDANVEVKILAYNKKL